MSFDSRKRRPLKLVPTDRKARSPGGRVKADSRAKKGSSVNLKELEVFRAVMMSGTTTAAADLLHMSQPAVSRHLAGLEACCGTKLFLRRHGRLQSTPEADALLSEIHLFYDGFNKIDQFVRGMTQLKAGHLRVLATSPMAYGPLPHVMARFRQDYPEATASVRIVPRRELRDGLEEQSFDIGIVTLPIDYPLASLERLVKVPGVCVMPLDHRLAGRQMIELRDLQGESFISASSASPTRHAIDNILARANVTCNRTTETHSALSICKMVAVGLGVSLVDPFTAHMFQRQIAVLPLRAPYIYEFGIIYPIRRSRSRLAQAFSEYVRETINEIIAGFRAS